MRITGITAVSVQQNLEVPHALLELKQVIARVRYETKTDFELQKKREKSCSKVRIEWQGQG